MKCQNYRCGTNVFVRMIHTLLCIFVPGALIAKDTVLSRSLLHGENLAIGILYLLLLGFSLSMYYVACLIDPGYLPIKKKKPIKSDLKVESGPDLDGSDSDENSTMLKFITDDGDFKYRLCDYCEIQQPMRAKHCEDCGKCVRKYDHHCPWLEACIGERNHRFFWLFLLANVVLIPWTFYITWEGITFQILWGEWIKINILLFFNMLILLIGGFVVTGLFGFHSFLMLRGLTTWEAAARDRITYLKYLDEDYNPFNEGVFKNMFYFLCFCHERKWEGVYSEQAELNNSVV